MILFQDDAGFESRDESAARSHDDQFSLNPNFFEKFSAHRNFFPAGKLTPRKKREVDRFKPSTLVR